MYTRLVEETEMAPVQEAESFPVQNQSNVNGIAKNKSIWQPNQVFARQTVSTWSWKL